MADATAQDVAEFFTPLGAWRRIRKEVVAAAHGFSRAPLSDLAWACREWQLENDYDVVESTTVWSNRLQPFLRDDPLSEMDPDKLRVVCEVLSLDPATFPFSAVITPEPERQPGRFEITSPEDANAALEALVGHWANTTGCPPDFVRSMVNGIVRALYLHGAAACSDKVAGGGDA